jgi:hypothetical protein
MSDDHEPTEWEQGRYKITRQKNPKGWNYNYTITVTFQTEHDYLKSSHSEDEIAERWYHQIIKPEHRQKVVA